MQIAEGYKLNNSPIDMDILTTLQCVEKKKKKDAEYEQVSPSNLRLHVEGDAPQFKGY